MEAEQSHPPLEQSPAMPLSAAVDAFTPDAMDTAEAPVGMVEGSDEDEPSASLESEEASSDQDDADADSVAEGAEPGGTEARAAVEAAQGPGTGLQTQFSGSSWAQKRPLPAPVAVGKRPAVSPTSSGDSKAASERTVKRRNLFPKIKASEKCGKCENCLNPQRKKACVEARRRQMELMKKQAPAGQQRSTASARPAPAVAAAAADNPAANDPYLRELERIMSPSGAVVQAKNIPMLLQLLRSARTLAHRYTVMTVLERSPAEVLQAVVRQGALLQLQSWLGQYLADHKPKGTAKILTCLSRLPVTTEALKPPCELGKMVGKLRKEESLEPATREQARLLVARWKRVVEQEQQNHSRDGAGATTSQDGSGRAGEPSARPAAAGTGRQAGATSAGNGAPAKAFAALADDDMFAAADKQRATVKEAATQQRKVVRLEVEATRGRPAGPAAEPSQPSSPTSAAGEAGPTTSAATAAKAKAEFSKASSSPFDSLTSFSAGVSMIGGAGTSTTLSRIGSSYTSAAQRAAEAAKRVPSPEPAAERKEKRKKVSWVKEDALADVRWFLKVDPPVAAKSDADLSEQRQAAAEGPTEPDREASPPGFEMAAKKEHLSEAEALRRHREEEDEERTELQDRLSHMTASVSWFDPPLLATASPAAMAQLELAPGSASEERQRQAARCSQAPRAAYTSLAAVPTSPAEPNLPADLGASQPLHQIRRIPLSLEEAAALRQAQQPQQQQAQQQAQPAGQPPQLPQQQLAGQPQRLQDQAPIHAQGQMPVQQAGPMLAPGLLPGVSQPPGSQPGPTSGMLALQLPNGQVDAGVLAQLASSGLLQAPQGLPPGAVILPAQPHQQQQGAPPGMRPVFHNQAPPQHQQQQPGLAPFGQPGQGLVQGPMGAGQQPAQAAPAYLLQPQQPRALLGPGVLNGHGQLPVQQQHQQQQGQQQPQYVQQHQWGSQQPRPTGAPLLAQPWQQQQQQQVAAGPAATVRPQFGQGQPAAPPPQQQHSGHPQRRQIPCKFFNTPKGCVHGDKCRFAHIPANQGAAGGYSNHGSQNKRTRPDDSAFDRGGGGPGLQQRNKQPRVWDKSGPSRQ